MPVNITPFLWFDDNLDEALRFYTEVFPDTVVHEVSRYGPGAAGPEGTVMTATFEIAGTRLMGLNGGPYFHFTEAFSLFVSVDTQDEIDRLWSALTGDGGQESQCGWLKDKFGLSWQIVPTALPSLLGSPDPGAAGRAMQAMLQMRKLDIAALRAAHDGS